MSSLTREEKRLLVRVVESFENLRARQIGTLLYVSPRVP